MFEDFDPATTSFQAKKRFRRSMVVAVVICGTSSAAMVAATNVAKQRFEDVEPGPTFITQPRPAEADEDKPADAPPSEPPPKRTRKVQPKQRTRPPEELPRDKPQESDAPLTASEQGLGTGMGTGGGTGTGNGIASSSVKPPPLPPTPPERLIKPVLIRSDDRPRYPVAARRKGIEGLVIVAFDVLEDGHVANVRIVSGPEELHASVLEAASHWRYKPAYRAGKAVRYHMTRAVMFRLEDAFG